MKERNEGRNKNKREMSEKLVSSDSQNPVLLELASVAKQAQQHFREEILDGVRCGCTNCIRKVEPLVRFDIKSQKPQDVSHAISVYESTATVLRNFSPELHRLPLQTHKADKKAS